MTAVLIHTEATVAMPIAMIHGLDASLRDARSVWSLGALVLPDM